MTVEQRVAKVKALYPDVWARVRAACQHGSSLVDLDDHAARVVLAVKEGAR